TFACQLADQIAFAVSNRERIAAQQVLAESDERYRAFLSHSNEGIFRFEAGCDIPVTLPEEDQIALFIEHGYLAECNDAYARMFGYEQAEDIIGAGIGRMMELDSELTLDYMHSFIRSGYRLENYESMDTDQKGNSRWFSDTLTGILRDGKIVRIWGVQRDITNHRQAEQQLEESEAKFRFLTEKMNDIVWTTDLDFRTTYVSPSVAKILGFTPEERMRQEVTEQLAPASLILARTMLTRALESLQSSPPEPEPTYNLPLEFCHKNGSTVWLECLISGIRNEKGVLIGIHGVSRDITDRRKAEEQLAESESFNRGLVENMPDYIAVYGLDGKLVYVNPASARGLEYEPDLLVGTHVLTYVAKEDRDIVAAHMAARQNGGDTSPYEIDMVTRTGLRRSVIVKATPIKYQNNPAILLLLLDITERKRAEEALRESEERYRTLIDQLPDYVLVHRNGTLLYANPAAAVRLGYDEKQFIGKSLLPFIAPEYHDTVRKAITQRMTDEGFPPYEIKIIAGDGSYHTVLVNGALITFEGEPASLNVLTDITSLKQAQEAIRSANEDLEMRVAERTQALILANEQLIGEITARTKAEQEITRSLKEKDLLLREIHHRVKNNLQIVASLLKLQSRYITDPNVLESIRDSQSRVRAMALVHERIYRSHNIAEINLKEYLKYLTSQIFSFFNTQHDRVGMLVTMDDLMANIDTVIPVGLIINELVSNSLKHAFSDGRKGTITIECTAQGEDMLRFVYHDSGAGMPAGFDWNNSETLGLRLVNDLVNQLNGTIATGTGPGTTLIITVEKKRDPGSS
ncbi:MAG: PAS domain S-box protein, partial [Methanoregula sp.]|nr:PAS domain S-box protein [Methanoregula sp.]